MEQYEQLPPPPLLFDDKETVRPIRRKRSDTIADYGGFIEKFKVKKTTDDCYTPAPVYAEDSGSRKAVQG